MIDPVKVRSYIAFELYLDSSEQNDCTKIGFGRMAVQGEVGKGCAGLSWVGKAADGDDVHDNFIIEKVYFSMNRERPKKGIREYMSGEKEEKKLSN